jgi:hypothetical protein
MPKSSRVLVLLPLATLAIYACSSDDTEAPGPGGGAQPASYDDVKYGPMLGGTSDEALASLAALLDSGAMTVDPNQAPTLTAPASGALPAGTIPTFTWQVGAVTTVKSAEPGAESEPTDAWQRVTSPLAIDTQSSERTAAPSLLAQLTGPRALFGPIRVAHAHGPAFSGTGTLLTFSSTANPKLLRIFSGSTSYTPSAEDFGKLVSAGSFTLHLVSAVFATNRVVTDGGPYDGSTTEFSFAN